MAKKAKLDLYKQHKAEYIAPKAPVLLRIGPARYLSIDGKGDPGGEIFNAAIDALYGAAFTIKMTRKSSREQDYAVAKLEALWPGDLSLPRREWRWTLLIRTPLFVTAPELRAAIKAQMAKGKAVTVRGVTLRTIREGRCVQMLHVGPYTREGPTWEAMLAFAQSKGLDFAGPHHEIYLSDPRRVAAAKLRTILRKPVR